MKCLNLKKLFLSFLFLSLALFGVFGIKPNVSLASVVSGVWYQTNGFYIPLGTGITGTFGTSSVIFMSVPNSGYGANVGFSLQSYTDSAYSTGYNEVADVADNYWNFATTSKNYFYNVVASSTLYYKLVFYDNNQWTSGSTNPQIYFFGDTDGKPYFSISGVYGGNTSYTQTLGTPKFDSITVGTSTVNVQGYWIATSTDGITQSVDFWYISDIGGRIDDIGQTASSTGNFSLNFPYTVPTAPNYTDATTTLVTNINFYASLYQTTRNYADESSFDTLLDSTSTSITSDILGTFGTSFGSSTASTTLNCPRFSCSPLAIGGCILDAGIFMLCPDKKVFDNYFLLQKYMNTKAPFGYFNSVTGSIGGLNASSTPTVSLTIPSGIKSAVVTPLDVSLGSLLWFWFILNMYRRLKHIQI